MGYKILGFTVWKGGKWYLRRRYGDRPQKLAAVAVVAFVLAAGIVAAMRAKSE